MLSILALIAQLGERQTEDLKVHSSILCQGRFFLLLIVSLGSNYPGRIHTTVLLLHIFFFDDTQINYNRRR